MKSRPKIGDQAEIRILVEAKHVIDFADEQLPAVLSTPSLIGLLERAARHALMPLMEPGENSLGTHVDVQHLAPTPLGKEIVCRARVIHVEDPYVTFAIEAFDEQERIARGSHKRVVIRKDRFAKRVQRKAGPST
jgi:predicted thioesterase